MYSVKSMKENNVIGDCWDFEMSNDGKDLRKIRAQVIDHKLKFSGDSLITKNQTEFGFACHEALCCLIVHGKIYRDLNNEWYCEE